MNEQRQQAYIELIQTLIACPKQETEILQANQELVDASLVQMMELVADNIAEQGNQNTANWLRRLAGELAQIIGIASPEATSEEYINEQQQGSSWVRRLARERELAQMLGMASRHIRTECFNFLTEVLQAVSDDPHPQSVYPLLEQNLDKLDENLQWTLESWAALHLLLVNSKQMAAKISNLSSLMLEFPQGNRASNVEIAIAGYKTALTVFTQDGLAKDWNWAKTQQNLGYAYGLRIKGDKADNIEAEISAYRQALQVLTQDAFPYDWAMTQYNLGYAYSERIKGDKAENIERNIAKYRQALEVHTQSAFPQDWARTQYNLGIIYCNQRIMGDKVENIEKGIAAYRQALQVYTQSAFPYEWAMTQYNLGLAYYERIKGDRAENTELALAAYRQALQVYTQSAFPYEWAMTQYNLGNAYSERIKGDKTENIEQALAAYRQALLVYTQDAFPQDWARMQNDLGNAYRERIKGDKADNIEQALWAYHQALQVYTYDASPYQWAIIQKNLGNAYHERIKGDKTENIEQALWAYRQALLVYTQDEFPQDWAQTQYNVGTVYSKRIKGDKAKNIEQALAAYRKALLVYTQNAFPQDWAQTQNNLGNAYGQRIKGDKAENIEQAISALHQALQVYTQSAFPYEWARTQINLGNAYSERIKGDKTENIEQAIAAYRQALQVYTQSVFPHEWASTQNGLGAAYWERIKGDKAENIEQALTAFSQALQVHTQDEFPQDWARTQNNLGAAYSDRIKGDKAENIEQALFAYRQALQVYTQSAFPQDWALAQNNIGHAYSKRIKGDKAENIEQALFAYRQTLQVYTQSAFPYEWARTQNNLGAAYSDRIKGDKAENLENALAAYQQALSVRTQEAFPTNWASTQNNLGNAYSDRIKEDKAENIEQAIAAFRRALQIHTPRNFPINCLLTSRVLGDIGFVNGNWQLAIEGYELAIAAVEQSRNWATKEERRQEIIKESIGVYINIVQACINLGQLDKAIEYVERSRSKRLIDLMASNDLYRDGEIPAKVREKLQEYEALQQQINRERIPHQPDNNRAMQETDRSYLGRAALKASSEKIAQLEAQKQQVWEELRKLDFDLASEIQVNPPNIAAMQQLIASPTAAILSFYTTNDDTHIFILRQNQTPQLYTCTGQGYDTLQLWIVQNWILPYVKKDRTEWLDQMSAFLGELAQRLQLENLISQHLGDIQELILVPHLYLHQIPFAALPINQLGEYFSDKFILRTVPSCQVLEFCHRRPPIAASINYGTVEDATEDLPCAAFECEQIVQMHGIPDRLRLKGSQATVENYRQLAKQVHVLHSSHHAQSRLDNPLESHLQLGNGIITLGELMSPGWRLPDLEEVFLSCCETGFGVTEITDDIITIATGFLCAGARSVIGTLWSVNDIATAMFCIFYY